MNEITKELDLTSMTVESGTVAILNASEIEQQISTARRFPRSLQSFQREALDMVTLNEAIAQECIYSIPRDGKVIEGPSARFAEIIASAWGNCRAGARIINEGREFVTAQGVFHDMQRNVAITYEVQRRIVTSKGKRFGPDMIGVTANAACSIALRNTILKGVPKAFWNNIYLAARETVMGDFKTLANRRADAVKAFISFGVTKEQVFALLNIKGIEDIGREHLVTLGGVLTAIKEGDTTPEQIFSTGNKDVSPPAPPPQDKKKPEPEDIEDPNKEPEAKKEPEKEPEAKDEPKKPPRFEDLEGDIVDNENGVIVPTRYIRRYDNGKFSVLNGYLEFISQKGEKADNPKEAEKPTKAPPPPPPQKTSVNIDDVPVEATEFIASMSEEMTQVSDLDELDAIWLSRSPEDVLDFPPDLDDAKQVYIDHQKRLGRKV